MDSIIRSINHIARLATLYREKELKKFGLGGMHHTYIFNICRHPGITQEELSKIIFVNKSSVARQVAILEERGFVLRKPSPEDARKLLVYPTEKALVLNPILAEVLRSWNEQVLTDFSIEEQEALNQRLLQLKERSQILLEEEEGLR